MCKCFIFQWLLTFQRPPFKVTKNHNAVKEFGCLGRTVAIKELLRPRMNKRGDIIIHIFLVFPKHSIYNRSPRLQPNQSSRLPILQGGTFSLITPTLAILALPKWQCPVAGPTTMDPGNATTPLATEDPDQLWMTRLREVCEG